MSLYQMIYNKYENNLQWKEMKLQKNIQTDKHGYSKFRLFSNINRAKRHKNKRNISSVKRNGSFT